MLKISYLSHIPRQHLPPPPLPAICKAKQADLLYKLIHSVRGIDNSLLGGEWILRLPYHADEQLIIFIHSNLKFFFMP